MSVFEVFLAPIFPHSGWIRRDTEYLSVFSPNAGKYEPEKLRIRILFTQWLSFGNKCFTRNMNLGIIKSSIRFIKDSKRFNEPLLSWYRQYVVKKIKVWNMFLFSITFFMFYVTPLLWRAVRFSTCACIVLYIYLFHFCRFSVVCRCVFFDE